MLPIQVILAPLADKGLRLHTYPHPEKDGIWVLRASTLYGDKSAHVEMDGALLAQTFPPEGGTFIAERRTSGDKHWWTFKLIRDETEVLVQEFPPETNVFVAMKDFFSAPLMWALAPKLRDLIANLG